MLNLLAAAAAMWTLAMPQMVPPGMAGHPPPERALSPIAEKRLPQFLTSGDNDLIVIRLKKAGASRPDIVQVCLVNRSRSGARKALDNHRTKQPRYAADNNQTNCGNIHPTRHTLYFWKTKSGGRLKPVLKQKLDLSGYAGFSVRFEWLDD